MITASGQWTLGVLIGLPLIGLLVLLLLVAIIYLFILAIVNPDKSQIGSDWSARKIGIVWSSVLTFVLLVVLLITTLAYWPLKAEYHQYRTVTGTVQQVTSRLISAGDKGGSNQKFVVILRERPGTPYGITDTRAALLKAGDRVDLRCKRVYEYGSNNAGYDCKWGRG